MTRYYCDYCDMYLPHDSAVSRRQHNYGWKHRDNYRIYYERLALPQATVPDQTPIPGAVMPPGGSLPPMGLPPPGMPPMGFPPMQNQPVPAQQQNNQTPQIQNPFMRR
uniref:Matrin-type domain-containing protein n=1 Tax=Aplanochytrium stocchinoi TaxID=215587 RepID=A0A7S3PDU6_9STRA|mmetsp:Transcript_8329/g.9460  ORF Transcript_8329/g.9460 Transcript_8329/m.9460 type:complete len:108 (+) Transcript_8329:92-415(+)|eukprot:CAMPEP_0204829808 /NCGR_PEP_ID=MMETSP1346-20131115/8163_1 /ASSEMBLY_ACC=CAM_ASM_000771 /TAXON_ID=215587 /ORGANISM="Aplanochytrium stocchinoi, Strain GSBS06" /LENGTH=107 /DNA_ID=CAMNT_0051959895 /DNA_START=86 /DNA_END=409 /DNA_ORIENTATION=-